MGEESKDQMESAETIITDMKRVEVLFKDSNVVEFDNTHLKGWMRLNDCGAGYMLEICVYTDCDFVIMYGDKDPGYNLNKNRYKKCNLMFYIDKASEGVQGCQLQYFNPIDTSDVKNFSLATEETADRFDNFLILIGK